MSNSHHTKRIWAAGSLARAVGLQFSLVLFFCMSVAPSAQAKSPGGGRPLALRGTQQDRSLRLAVGSLLKRSAPAKAQGQIEQQPFRQWNKTPASPQALEELLRGIHRTGQLIHVGNDTGRESTAHWYELYRAGRVNVDLGWATESRGRRSQEGHLEVEAQRRAFIANQTEALRQELAQMDRSDLDDRSKMTYAALALEVFKKASPATGVLFLQGIYTSETTPRKNLIAIVRAYNTSSAAKKIAPVEIKPEINAASWQDAYSRFDGAERRRYLDTMSRVLNGEQGSAAAKAMHAAIYNYYKDDLYGLYQRVAGQDVIGADNKQRAHQIFTSLTNHLLYAGQYKLHNYSTAAWVLASDFRGDFTGKKIFSSEKEYRQVLQFLHADRNQRQSDPQPFEDAFVRKAGR